MKTKQKTNSRSKKPYLSIPKSNSQPNSLIRIITLIIIISAIVLVIVAIIILPFLKPENLVKSKIDTLTRDYYENVIYDDLVISAQQNQKESFEEIMQKYELHGFSRIALRQLLLNDIDKNAEVAEFLRQYCDENKTFAQVFPEAPYSKSSYHIKYTYSCNF